MGLEFLGGDMDSLPDELKAIIQRVVFKTEQKRTLVAKLTSDEVAEFQLLESRKEAAVKTMKRLVMKIELESKNIWAKLQEKYDVYDDHLQYDSKTGEIYSVSDISIDDKTKEEKK